MRWIATGTYYGQLYAAFLHLFERKLVQFGADSTVLIVRMDGEQLNFVDLRALLNVTDGNLGAHLQKLEQAGYIQAEKAFVERKPCTWLRATSDGERAYSEHVQFLRDIVGG